MSPITPAIPAATGLVLVDSLEQRPSRCLPLPVQRKRHTLHACRLHRLQHQWPDARAQRGEPSRRLWIRGLPRASSSRCRHDLPDRRRRQGGGAWVSSRSKSTACNRTTTSPTPRSSARPRSSSRRHRTGSRPSKAGEPNHAGDPGGHSVWYSWTPSSSGPVHISACDYKREIDTLLAVYTGSAVDALTPLASNDDARGAAVERTLRIRRSTARSRSRPSPAPPTG